MSTYTRSRPPGRTMWETDLAARHPRSAGPVDERGVDRCLALVDATLAATAPPDVADPRPAPPSGGDLVPCAHPGPVDPARVRAVLAVLGWPAADRVCWALAEDVVRAANTPPALPGSQAGGPAPDRHLVEVADGTRAVQHPADCLSPRCEARQLLDAVPGGSLPTGRYEVRLIDPPLRAIREGTR